MTSTQHEGLIQKARAHLIRYGGEWTPPVILRGQGTRLTDVDGREYLDFSSGQMCATLGHSHPRVVAAIRASADRVMHLNSLMLSPETIELAARLTSLLPEPLSKCIFLSTGSESNEVALKLAKYATGRFETIGLTLSFHGLTSGAVSGTFSVGRKGHGPVLPSFALPAPYCYRCPVDRSFPGCDILCLRVGMSLIDAESAGSLAACLAEPIMCAGGIIVPPQGYFPALRDACSRRGIVLIIDEAQTAFGRLGAMFSFEQDGAAPDILTLSKTLGGGLPISAAVTSPELEEKALAKGFYHITSHVSDPLPSAVALAVLDVIAEENLTRRTRKMGEDFQAALRRLAERYEVIGDIRGRGLLIGVEFVKDRATKEPAEEEGAKITQECLRRGLIVSIVRFPGSQSVWRIAPPLTTTAPEFEQALSIIDDSIRAVCGGQQV